MGEGGHQVFVYRPYFFDQTPQLLFLSLFALVRPLFKGDVRLPGILLGSQWIAKTEMHVHVVGTSR